MVPRCLCPPPQAPAIPWKGISTILEESMERPLASARALRRSTMIWGEQRGHGPPPACHDAAPNLCPAQAAGGQRGGGSTQGSPGLTWEQTSCRLVAMSLAGLSQRKTWHLSICVSWSRAT